MRRGGKIALYVWIASEVIDWVVLPAVAAAWYFVKGAPALSLPF